MKKIYVLLAVFLMFGFQGMTQSCINGAITFTTQSELDAFPNNYPTCIEINGNVIIDTAITNLQGLNQITAIGGTLLIRETVGLANLNGLENLTSVGDLDIRNNAALVSLAGLGNLAIVEDDFDIRENSALKDFTGLDNLTTIGGDVNIYNNEILFNFLGLENLTTIGGYDVLISQNNFLKNLNGFGAVNAVPGDFRITNNKLLSSLEGLQNLNKVGYSIFIIGNDSLENLVGLEGLDSIIYSLKIENNISLENFEGLSGLSFIGDDFRVYNNMSLVNFTGLDNLTEIIDYFWIENNSALQDFSGLHPSLNYISYLFLGNNDLLVNLSGLENLDSLGGTRIKNNDLLVNMQGFEGITSINSICEISGNPLLTSLEGMNNIHTFGSGLDFESNPNLTNFLSLESIQRIEGRLTIEYSIGLKNLIGLESLTYAYEVEIRYNDSLQSLIGFENLDSIGNLLSLRENKNLTELGPLNSLVSIGGNCIIWYNHALTNLIGFKKLKEVTGDFHISSNDKLFNLEGLDSLKIVGGNFRVNSCDSLINLDGIENLEIVGAIDGDIRLNSNDNLEDISGLGNVDLSNIVRLSVYSNSKLSVCDEPNICDCLASGGDYTITDNSAGCNTLDEVILACAYDLSKVNFNIFYDINQNGIQDTLELYMPNSSVTVLPTEDIFYSNINLGGYAFLDSGSYEIQLNQNLNNNWTLTTDSTSFQVEINNIITCDTVAFGLYPTAQVSEMLSFINAPPARCGEFKNFETHAKNMGTTITSGTLWLEVDEQIAATDFIDIPDTTVLPNLYGWHFQDLYPGYDFSKIISLQIPTPPEVILGDSLYFYAYVEFSDTNGSLISDVFYYPTEIRCSFDPNDKLVSPARNNNYTLFEEDLLYTIRFQNTGNDEAYDIIIRDTLDNNLDPTSFRVLSTSHPNSLITSMEADQYLTFNFENIYLPDSTTDFDASQGYVSYRISPKEGLDEETPITNTASIYFDYNPPIVTNTTENVMVSELPTSIYHIGGTEGMNIEVFPNPVSDFLFIKKDKVERLEYQIIDVNGRLWNSGEFINTIHSITFTKMNAGVYFIKIIDPETGESIVDKIVK